MHEHVIDSKKTALILIDLQNDLIKTDKPPYDVVTRMVIKSGIVANAARVVEGVRKKGIPIIYIEGIRRPDGGNIPKIITDEGKDVISRLEGSYGAKTVDELKPLPGDYIIHKQRASSFYGTPLEFYLRSCLAIDTLLIGGVSTSMGVEYAVREARVLMWLY